MRSTPLNLALAALVFVSLTCLGFAYAATQPETRASANKAMTDGNWKDAYDTFSKLALDPANDTEELHADFNNAVACLQRLGRTNEIDAFRDKAIATHKDSWRFKWTAAKSFQNGESYGFIIANEFYRGGHRGEGGRQVSAVGRDRVRALRLMDEAARLLDPAEEPTLAGGFYFELAEMLLNSRQGGGAWQLQFLTDLSKLPDYEEFDPNYGWRHGHDLGGNQGAPVDEAGTPIYHKLPASWAAAKTDGERWRWCLEQSADAAPTFVGRARYTFAQFLQSQFDVTTMLHGGYGAAALLGRGGAGEKDESGPYAVSTLADDETVARLATGVKRFKLPDEFNFIKVFQDLVARNPEGWGQLAGESLAQVFEDRQQYARAAEYWRATITAFGPGHNNHRRQRLDQIVGNWGMFEPVSTRPAGRALELPFVYRNGRKVRFQAWSIDVPRVLEDVKNYIRSKPQQFQHERLDVEQLGHRIVTNGQRQYLKEKVAAWDLDLPPRDQHYDRRIDVKTPIKNAGAYLVEATMENGNTTRIVAWVADTVIVKKRSDDGSYCFVADAVTGAPVAGATVDFFGWRQVHLGDNKFRVDTKDFSHQTDGAGGVVTRSDGDQDGQYQYLITATGDGGRLAYLGFSGLWSGKMSDAQATYDAQKFFTITDRPVYRPGQTVKFKFWVGRARYDQEGPSPYAGQSFNVIVQDPRGEKVLEKPFTTDAFGGFDGAVALGDAATLGRYTVEVEGHGGGTFRVEEYKKPEFEVTVDAPTEPVTLGDKITATIKSSYYFGAPVTSAKVKYKVLRSTHDARWFPAARWDWMYEPGYWWFAPDRAWFPGFERWGCRAPLPWWYGAPQSPPEVVLENEVPVGQDGTVKVEIDTALAKAINGDQDHKYEITAEVTDESRRTIVGTGSVTVAREPFKVYAWTDRGHYAEGDTVEASFKAQTLDQKPIDGGGVLRLFQVTYDARQKPVETEVQKWDLKTDADGAARVQVKAARPGQYRLSYVVTDAKRHAVEGGYVFVVRGTKFDGREFRFNDLELITDKKEYAPGEKVRLMINANRPGGTVALFVRPAHGMYLPPKLIRLDGKSTIEEIEVAPGDMPNYYVEALTVADGRVHQETREVVVPPARRVVDVKVTASQAKYKPGERATVKVRLTGADGKPVVGSAVISVYDKSVEYVSGGSNVEEIKAFFWKWRRQHNPDGEATLSRYGYPAYGQNELQMSFLGRFGHMVAQEEWKEQLASGDGFGERDTALLPSDRFANAPALSLHDGRAYYRQGRARGVGGGASLFGGGMAPAAARSASPAESFRDDISASKASRAKPAAVAGGAAGDAPLATATVRKNFADTALWVGAVTTSAAGEAEVSLDMPENLTTWKTRVWSMSDGTRVGEGSAEVTTYKNLLVRLQAPRFFVQKDEVVLSANVHNYLKGDKRVSVTLELEGQALEPVLGDGQIGGLVNEPEARATTVSQSVEVAAGGERRVDWRVKVKQPGTATVRVVARTDEESDATEQAFPVYVHGMLRTESYSGAIRPQESSGAITFRVPAERLPEQSRLEVRYSPSVAAAMVDAAPYLADFPYGCTEQTLNRFVPTVITRKTLIAMGIDLKDVAAKRANLNAQQVGDDAQRAADWKRRQRANYNPVFDEAMLDAMITQGVAKLASQQVADGGWGWFSGYGEQSWPHTTAVVVHGLQVARAAGVALPGGMLERGVEWLKRFQAQQTMLIKNAPAQTDPYKNRADDIDAFVYMVLADAGAADGDMREFLFRDRNDLSVYSKAVFGVALHKQGQNQKLGMILQNINQYLVQDEENQTAYLKLPEGNHWWHWYGSDTEANAFYLKLLARTDPKGKVASRLAKYLVNNRRNATYWNSTRDSAYCIEALGEFVTASGEDKPDMTVAVLLDGKKQKEVRITADNFFGFDNKFVLEGADVPAGEHRIEFVKTGKGPLYFNAYVTNFTLEDPIKKAGLDIKVQRKFYKLVRVDKSIKAEGARGQAVDQKVEKFERRLLDDGDTLKSGDLVEVELEIDSKNDYEYVLFEDMKASGFEAVDTQSGYNGNDLGAYMELRDERVCFFARALARGKHSVSYKLRAEIPGRFSALPAKGSGMYAPELRANSDEGKLGIVD